MFKPRGAPAFLVSSAQTLTCSRAKEDVGYDMRRDCVIEIYADTAVEIPSGICRGFAIDSV